MQSLLHNRLFSIQFCDMLIGYARVSTEDQDLRLQCDALKEAGCKRTFEEKVSGAKRDRPGLMKMIEQLRDDDTVVVTRLDRLARSTRDLLDISEKLEGCQSRPTLASRALGRYDFASRPHGTNRVRRHRRV